MQQIIIDFGRLWGVSIRIFGYGLMMVLGFLAAIAIGRWRTRRMGENPDVMVQIGFLSLIGGVLGARLAFVIQPGELAKLHSLGAILDITSGGLVYYGGVVLAAMVVLVYLRIKRLPIRRCLDMVAVSLMVGLAFGRAGCLLNGCCYGGRCRHDWALGTRFPMYSKPLLNFDGRDNPFSRSQVGPSPVYHHQLIRRAAAKHNAGETDGPAVLGLEAANGVLVSPPPQLVCFKATDWAVIGPDGKEGSIPMLRLHPPHELHGRLQGDQLGAAVRSEQQAREAFNALAGTDKLLNADEWHIGLKAGDGLLAGCEHWNEALLAENETSRDGKLDFAEFRAYTAERMEVLIDRFDEDGDGVLTARGEVKRANAYLQADEIALAEAATALPVKPAQVLGIANALLLALILGLFYRLRRREGQVFALLLVLYPITRFILEVIRGDNQHDLLAVKLTHNQWASVAMLAFGAAALVLLRRLPPSCGPAWAQRLAESDNNAKG